MARDAATREAMGAAQRRVAGAGGALQAAIDRREKSYWAHTRGHDDGADYAALNAAVNEAGERLEEAREDLARARAAHYGYKYRPAPPAAAPSEESMSRAVDALFGGKDR